MYRPKKYVRLDPLSRTPRLADVRNLLDAANKSRSCTVEQPWKSENLKMPFSLTVRVELGGNGEPIWTLYEGDGSKSRVMWSTGFGDVELLYDVLTLSLPSDGPNIFDPNSRPSNFSPTVSSTKPDTAVDSSSEQRPASFYDATDFSSPASSNDSAALPPHLAGDDFYKSEPTFESASTANKSQTSEFMIESTNVTIAAGANNSGNAAATDPAGAPSQGYPEPASSGLGQQSGLGQHSGQYQAAPGNPQNYPPGMPQPYLQGAPGQTGEHNLPMGQPGYPANNPQNYPANYPQNYPGNYPPNYPGAPGQGYPQGQPGNQVQQGQQGYPQNYPGNYPPNYNPNYPQGYPANYNPNYPQGYPPNYQYSNAQGPQAYPPGYPQNYPGAPQAVPGDGLNTASTVPVSYGPGGTPVPVDPYSNMAMLPHPDLIKKRPVVMLGTFLVEAGLVPSSTIDAALQVQALVSQGTLSAMKAAEAVRRAHQRGGYVEPENIQATATNEAIVRVKPQLGQVLVMAGIITATQLKASLRLQEAMHAGALTMPEAVDTLHRELSLAANAAPKAESEKIDPEETRKIVALLKQAGMLSDGDIDAATKIDATAGANVLKVLVASSKLDQLTIDAATSCQRFIDGGHLRPDQAFMALHYCQRMRVSFEEAASELALDTKK